MALASAAAVAWMFAAAPVLRADDDPPESAGTGAHPETEIPRPSQQQKADLGPHAILINSALESAKNQVDGLKSQVDNRVSSNSAYQVHLSNLRADVGQAMSQKSQLGEAIVKYPQLRTKENYRQLQASLDAVNALSKSLSANGSHPAYWTNKDQAKSDLDRLSDELGNAISRTKDVRSDIGVG
jgi:hypothetical protein